MSIDAPRAGHARANGIRFEFLELGERPLALCLHGFPDSPSTWRFLMPALAEAGYRAVAPWLRGYAPTEEPADGDYSAPVLVSDTCALHDVLGGDEDAILIGHDFGGMVTWGAGAHSPERWCRAVAIAVPPLPVAGAALQVPEHIRRGWHFFYFQMSGAEHVIADETSGFLEELLRPVVSRI